MFIYISDNNKKKKKKKFVHVLMISKLKNFIILSFVNT